jgi:hypothetical protein
MNPPPEQNPAPEAVPVRQPYEKPELKRVDLAMAETLSKACKLDTGAKNCVFPIYAKFGGS